MSEDEDRRRSLVGYHQAKIFQWQPIKGHLRARIEAALAAAGLDSHQLTTRIKTESSFVAKGLKREIDGRYRYAGRAGHRGGRRPRRNCRPRADR